MKPVLKDEIKPPLIVFPHGGPHTAFTSDFFLYSACLCKLGFSILNGKYDGSHPVRHTPLYVLLRVQSGIISTISPVLALSLSRNTTGERVQGQLSAHARNKPFTCDPQNEKSSLSVDANHLRLFSEKLVNHECVNP